MAGAIKGITISFNGDTTKLDSALRDINNNTRKLDKELRSVDKALKFNPTSVELWRQKQQLLTQKINETKSKLDVLKQAQAKMDAEGVDKNSEEYRKLQREIIVAENQLKTFEGQLRKIGQVNLRAASEQFKEYGTKLTAAGNAMKGLSTAAAALDAAIGALTIKSAKWADNVNTMSKVYGIGTGELQKYSAAADLVDVSTEDIARANTKLKKSMYSAKDGSGAAAEAYKALGVDVVDANGNLRDSDAVFQDVLKALGEMENETERDALAMQLMGKSAQNLNPLIADGGETYKNVADTLKKYNLDFISQEDLDAANEFNDQIDTIKTIGLVAFQSLGTQLAGYLAPALEKVVEWVGKFAEWLGNLNPAVLTVVGIIAAVVAAIAPVLLVLGKVAFAISSIMSLMSTIGPAIAAISGPVGIAVAIIAGLVALGVLLYKNWDTIKAKAQELWTKIQEVWEGIKTSIAEKMENVKKGLEIVWNAIKTGAAMYWNLIKTAILGPVGLAVKLIVQNWSKIKTAASSAWASIKSTASSAWNGIKNAMINPIKTAVGKVKDIINKIKGFFPLNIGKLINFSIPKISLTTSSRTVLGKTITYPSGFDISWHKKGGIFTQPTLLTDANGGVHGVGEAGPEAIVPLNTLWNKLDRIAESSGGDINIYINGADKSPREIAEEVKQILINETNRRRLAWQ